MLTVTDYLAKLTPAQKAEFERIRKTVKQVAPDAGERISYGMPAFTHNGKNIIYFGAFKSHMSIFPGSSSLIEETAGELTKFRTSKGTLQFTEDNPIPDVLIKQVVAHRLKDIDKKS